MERFKRWHTRKWVDGVKTMGTAHCNCAIAEDHTDEWYDDNED